MAILFYSLAPHIQLQVVEKTGWKEFLKFQKASRHSQNISQNLKKKITLNVENINLLEIDGAGFEYCEINRYFQKLGITLERRRQICLKPIESPFRFYAYTLRFGSLLTDDLLNLLVPLFRTKRIVAVGLAPLPMPQVTGIYEICSPEKFNLLLEASSIRSLHEHHRVPIDYVKVPAFRRLSNIDCRCPITDEDLLSLKTEFMWIVGTHVTSEGMNRYLKEYLAGKRKIKVQTIRSSRPFESSIVLEGIPFMNVAEIVDQPLDIFRIIDETKKSGDLSLSIENRTISLERCMDSD